MKRIYLIDEKIATEIAFDEFIGMGLGNEECATIENIATFRLLCFKDAELFKKK